MIFSPRTALLSGLALCCLALTACTDADWDHAMAYGGLGGQEVASADPVVAPQPVQAPAQTPASNAEFCQAVAKQASTRDGFDMPTQQRMFQRSYQQCVAMFGATATASR